MIVLRFLCSLYSPVLKLRSISSWFQGSRTGILGKNLLVGYVTPDSVGEGAMTV